MDDGHVLLARHAQQFRHLLDGFCHTGGIERRFGKSLALDEIDHHQDGAGTEAKPAVPDPCIVLGRSVRCHL